MGRVFFFIREGLRALRRSAAPSLAAIVTVCITVLLLGVLIPVLQTTNGKTNEVRNQVGLRVFLNDVNGQQAPQDQIDALQAKLQAIPHVKQVHVRRQEPGPQHPQRAPQAGQPPGHHRAAARCPQSAAGLLQRDAGRSLEPGQRSERDHPARDERTADADQPADLGHRRLARRCQQDQSGATSAIRWVLGVISGLLLVASLLLVANTIRLSIYARRREVEVMRLVGATNWFIRWPFMVEGLVCGLVGAGIAIGFLFLGKQVIVDPLANNFNLISSGHTIPFASLALVLLCVAMGVSAMGSGLTLRRFLKI